MNMCLKQTYMHQTCVPRIEICRHTSIDICAQTYVQQTCVPRIDTCALDICASNRYMQTCVPRIDICVPRIDICAIDRCASNRHMCIRHMCLEQIHVDMCLDICVPRHMCLKQTYVQQTDVPQIDINRDLRVQKSELLQCREPVAATDQLQVYMLYRESVAAMEWLRLVGSLKLQVSFVKEPYKRDHILQKRPVILRSLLIVATPYRERECVSICSYNRLQACLHFDEAVDSLICISRAASRKVSYFYTETPLQPQISCSYTGSLLQLQIESALLPYRETEHNNQAMYWALLT